MNNFQSVIRNNAAIANEVARTGRLVNDDDRGFMPFRPKSQQTVQKERQEAKYTSRRNICDRCFTAKSVSGNHDCDD
jgi:hypothetical protein